MIVLEKKSSCVSNLIISSTLLENRITCKHFLKDFISLLFFREGRREGESEIEKHQCLDASQAPPMGTSPATQACALDWESNQ